MSILNQLREALIVGNAPGVTEHVEQLLQSGEEPQLIIDQGLLPAMDVVGEKFKNNEYFVPQVLFAARAMHAGMDILKPLLVGEKALKHKATIVLGTAQGDQHDIGKNLVSMLLESAGYNVINVGTDISPQKFVEYAQTEKAQVVGISALMTTTMSSMPDVVTALEQKGLRDSVKIIIGGAPVSQAYADEIGVDGYADNATDAVDLVNTLLK